MLRLLNGDTNGEKYFPWHLDTDNYPALRAWEENKKRYQIGLGKLKGGKRYIPDFSVEPVDYRYPFVMDNLDFNKIICTKLKGTLLLVTCGKNDNENLFFCSGGMLNTGTFKYTHDVVALMDGTPFNAVYRALSEDTYIACGNHKIICVWSYHYGYFRIPASEFNPDPNILYIGRNPVLPDTDSFKRNQILGQKQRKEQ